MTFYMGTVLPITTPPLCDIHKLFIKPLIGLFLFFRGRTFESAHTVSWGPTLSRPRPGGPRGYPPPLNTNDSRVRLRMRHVLVLCLGVLVPVSRHASALGKGTGMTLPQSAMLFHMEQGQGEEMGRYTLACQAPLTPPVIISPYVKELLRNVITLHMPLGYKDISIGYKELTEV